MPDLPKVSIIVNGKPLPAEAVEVLACLLPPCAKLTGTIQIAPGDMEFFYTEADGSAWKGRVMMVSCEEI